MPGSLKGHPKDSGKKKGLRPLTWGFSPERGMLDWTAVTVIPRSIRSGCGGAGFRNWLSGSHPSEPNDDDRWREAEHFG